MDGMTAINIVIYFVSAVYVIVVCFVGAALCKMSMAKRREKNGTSTTSNGG